MKKYLILAVTGSILFISGLIYLFVFLLPTMSDTYTGQVTNINNNLISIEASGTRSFDISQADFQGVTYGSLESGNAVTVRTSKTDLRVGKEVFLIVIKNSNLVRSVYISR